MWVCRAAIITQCYYCADKIKQNGLLTYSRSLHHPNRLLNRLAFGVFDSTKIMYVLLYSAFPLTNTTVSLLYI